MILLIRGGEKMTADEVTIQELRKKYLEVCAERDSYKIAGDYYCQYNSRLYSEISRYKAQLFSTLDSLTKINPTFSQPFPPEDTL